MSQQATVTGHVLEKRGPRSVLWHRVVAGIYRPAVILVYQERFVEGLAEAQRIRVQEWGSMHDVQFRIVTSTRTVTVLGSLKGAME